MDSNDGLDGDDELDRDDEPHWNNKLDSKDWIALLGMSGQYCDYWQNKGNGMDGMALHFNSFNS